MADTQADISIDTRGDLVAYLRDKCGYEGEDTLEAVKSFLTERAASESPIELVDESGSALDVGKIWTKTARKPQTIKFNTSASESASEKAARLAAKGVTRSSGGPIGRVASNDAGNAYRDTKTFRFGDAVSSHKRLYDQRVKSGVAKFSCADEAEAIGACIRLLSVKAAGGEYGKADEDFDVVTKAASSFNPTTGSVFIPDEFTSQLLYLTEKYGVARRLAGIVPMNRDFIVAPRITSNVTSSHVGQSATITASDPGTDGVQLTAKETKALIVVPNSFLEDSAVNVAEAYGMLFAEAQAKREDQDWSIGDGTSTYGGHIGLTNATGSGMPLPSGCKFNAAATGAWTSIVDADLLKLPGLCENVQGGEGAFMSSRQFYFQVVLPLVSATGRGTMNEFLTINGLGGPADAQYRGWPWYFNQTLPTATAATGVQCIFGDFKRGTMFGDRRQITVATSKEAYFTSDSYAFRMTARFGIHICGDGRGGTYGPITMLATG